MKHDMIHEKDGHTLREDWFKGINPPPPRIITAEPNHIANS